MLIYVKMSNKRKTHTIEPNLNVTIQECTVVFTSLGNHAEIHVFGILKNRT